jgi:CubicO group peptidase (beta-lactamase class C family)
MNTRFPIFIWILFFLACSDKKEDEVSDHPLENNLIANVQFVSNPEFFTVDERLKEHNIAGLGLGIIEDKELTFTKGYGFVSNNQLDVDSTTIFQVGSISKSILGLLSVILEEQGEISLDTLAIRYLKDWSFPENRFKAKEKITVRHLLNHTAGLNIYNSKGMSPFEEPFSLIDLLNGNEYSKGVSIDTVAGVQYKYSNYGYGIVQMILENQTGKSLEELSKEWIFDPLNMEKSDFKRVVPSEELKGYAFAHDYEGNLYNEYWAQPLILGSGGLRSTIKDLSTLLLVIQNAYDGEQKGFITPQIVDQIISEKGYNLGFEIEGEGNNLSITHTGRVPGFFAYMRLYPNTGKGLVMLCNSDNGGEIFKDILRGASDLYGWNIIQPKRINPIDVSLSDLNRYSGDYEITIDSTTYVAQFYVKDNHLQFRMKEEDEIYPLRMIEPDYFIDLIDGSSFDFEVKDSTISAFTLDNDLTFIKAK